MKMWKFCLQSSSTQIQPKVEKVFPLKADSLAHFETISGNWKPVKIDEHSFSFHIEKSCCSEVN